MRAVRIDITGELLLAALGFPKGAKLRRCFDKLDKNPCDVRLIVEHDDLPQSEHGKALPLATPVYSTEHGRPKLVDWGIHEA